MTRCAMCFLDKPLKRVHYGMEELEPLICRGCEMSIERVVGFLERAGLGVQRSLDLFETLPTPTMVEQAKANDPQDSLATRTYGEVPKRRGKGSGGSETQVDPVTP